MITLFRTTFALGLRSPIVVPRAPAIPRRASSSSPPSRPSEGGDNNGQKPVRRLPKVIFADTNILIGVVNDEYPVLRGGTALEGVTVHYTETVRSEYQAVRGVPLPSNFRYVESNLRDEHKGIAYRHLIELWAIPGPLTQRQQLKFRNDVYIVFEASSTMFSKRAGWSPELGAWPLLLTNNLNMYHRFLDSNQKEDVLEMVINAHGMEHLIEVVTLDRLRPDGTVVSLLSKEE